MSGEKFKEVKHYDFTSDYEKIEKRLQDQQKEIPNQNQNQIKSKFQGLFNEKPNHLKKQSELSLQNNNNSNNQKNILNVHDDEEIEVDENQFTQNGFLNKHVDKEKIKNTFILAEEFKQTPDEFQNHQQLSQSKNKRNSKQYISEIQSKQIHTDQIQPETLKKNKNYEEFNHDEEIINNIIQFDTESENQKSKSKHSSEVIVVENIDIIHQNILKQQAEQQTLQNQQMIKQKYQQSQYSSSQHSQQPQQSINTNFDQINSLNAQQSNLKQTFIIDLEQSTTLQYQQQQFIQQSQQYQQQQQQQQQQLQQQQYDEHLNRNIIQPFTKNNQYEIEDDEDIIIVEKQNKYIQNENAQQIESPQLQSSERKLGQKQQFVDTNLESKKPPQLTQSVSMQKENLKLSQKKSMQIGFPTLLVNRQQDSIQNQQTLKESNQTEKKGIGYFLHQTQLHENYRLNIEKFIVQFNKNPNEAIEIALKNKICDSDSNENIAYLIKNTQGLSKEKIGEFFKSPKERNQKILRCFCELFEFQAVQIDEAIRLFLSTFLLPKEAQEIDRILDIFGQVYTLRNPVLYKQKDSAYYLFHAILTMNVNIHNQNVDQKSKMGKEQFTNMYMAVLKGDVTPEQFGEYYEKLKENKLETKTDDMQLIYNHIGPIQLFQRKQQNSQFFQKNIDELKEGMVFVKYGRKGTPKERKIFLSQDNSMIQWKTNNSEEYPRGIMIVDIIDIVLGRNTTEIFRKNNIDEAFDQFCFSFITKYRSVDLRSGDIDKKNKWVYYIYEILKNRKVVMSEKIKMKRKNQIDQDRLSEIWRVDVFSNWEQHWDYRNNKPKNFENYNNLKLSQKWFQKLCSCFLKQDQHQTNNNDINKSMVATQQRNNERERLQDDELDELKSTNKSLLLVSLWKLGFPPWVRKTIWPLVIGNRLEVTQELQKILDKQVDQYLQKNENKQYKDDSVNEAMQKMEKDLDRQSNYSSQLIDLNLTQKYNLKRILALFIFYRPDIGYLDEVMPQLGAMLVRFLDPEEAFICYVNLIHSYHFLSFFRGEGREIEWRVRFFNDLLLQKYPLVYHHFKALDLSSDVFVMHWFVSLFTQSFSDINLLARLWDNFFLEGELFAFKIGLSIIEFYQLELKMSTFDEALKILKSNHSQLYEECLFDIIDNMKISAKDYADRLEELKVAKLNPEIHKILLD